MALGGITLEVPPGGIVGLVGLNGAGKTTAIRIAADLLDADAGSVEFFGHERRPGDDTWKRETGFVLDQPPPFEWMSAAEHLSFLGTLRGLAPAVLEKRSGELLEFLELSGRRDDPIAVYSTGMKKKIAFAAAALHAPRLLVLDEPLEGIDALAAGLLRDALRRMAERGTAVLISSHILDTMEKLCDRVAVLHHGTVLLECATGEIRSMVRKAVPTETCASLEELFLDAVALHAERKHLSW
jgi:ABC-2 type transport system ATP-binding protein